MEVILEGLLCDYYSIKLRIYLQINIGNSDYINAY